MEISDKFSCRDNSSFNMTPVIDIVFLLIIFFLVVCRFIEAENFPVTVPDDCKFAQSEPEPGAQLVTVTVMKTDEGTSSFAVGSQIFYASDEPDFVGKMTELLDARMENLPPENRTVVLRIDKDICFSDAQYALAAIAASSATDVQLAAIKNSSNNSQ